MIFIIILKNNGLKSSSDLSHVFGPLHIPELMKFSQEFRSMSIRCSESKRQVNFDSLNVNQSFNKHQTTIANKGIDCPDVVWGLHTYFLPFSIDLFLFVCKILIPFC